MQSWSLPYAVGMGTARVVFEGRNSMQQNARQWREKRPVMLGMRSNLCNQSAKQLVCVIGCLCADNSGIICTFR